MSGVLAPKPSSLVTPSCRVRFCEPANEFVSRGGKKLNGAIEAFDFNVVGLRAADIGASTGGFTDCLLQRGVKSVTAIDVGHGQFAWTLRNDPRVTVLERTNIRLANPVTLGGPFDLVVADLSFIGLQVVSEQLAVLGGESAHWILLVKPQFEAGRDAVGARGIVADPARRAGAVVAVADAFFQHGIGTFACVESQLPGAKSGNREYFLWLRKNAPAPDSEILTQIVCEHD